jgi:hypothetical protein
MYRDFKRDFGQFSKPGRVHDHLIQQQDVHKGKRLNGLGFVVMAQRYVIVAKLLQKPVFLHSRTISQPTMMTPSELTAFVKQEALNLGFSACA